MPIDHDLKNPTYTHLSNKEKPSVEWLLETIDSDHKNLVN